MNEPIRILQILPSINKTSGIYNVIFNWHKHIDTSKVQFDYLYFSQNFITNQEDILNKLGSKIYKLPHPYKYPLRFLLHSYRFFKDNHYKTIHSHLTNLNLFFYPLAKLFGTRNIIQHSHLTKWSDKRLNGFRNYLMLHAVWPLITHKMACSKAAGKAYFGKNFIVINNGINIDKFTYNPDIRAKKRKELGLEDNFIIGHIGRFNPQKNHEFLIDIFEKIVKLNQNAKLMLIGDGPLEQKIKQLVIDKHLQNKVIFLGVRDDVAELYQAFDLFILPSLFEGLGIVAVEAQAAGLPCLLADTLPREAFICNYKKLPLTSADKWSKEIISITDKFKRENTFDKINAAGFSSIKVGKQMQNFYEELNK